MVTGCENTVCHFTLSSPLFVLSSLPRPSFLLLPTPSAFPLPSNFLLLSPSSFLPSPSLLPSLSAVLAELLRTELSYLCSLETLVQVYLPAIQEQHVPTFLQGRKQAIFSNVEELFQFHR